MILVTGTLSSNSCEDATHRTGFCGYDTYAAGAPGQQAGGNGEFYKADDLKLDQTAALKFLPEALALDSAMLARFHDEAHRTVEISIRSLIIEWKMEYVWLEPTAIRT